MKPRSKTKKAVYGFIVSGTPSYPACPNSKHDVHTGHVETRVFRTEKTTIMRVVTLPLYSNNITLQLYLTFITLQLYYQYTHDNEAAMLPITSPKTLGKVLRRYRKELGLSQSEAGKKFNLPQKTVSNIEAGLAGVHLGTLFRYMSALGLEMHLGHRSKSSDDEALW